MRRALLALALVASAPVAGALHATGELFVTAYLIEGEDFAYFTVVACASEPSRVRATLVWLPDVRDSARVDMGELEQRGVGSCGWWMDRLGFVLREGEPAPAECVRVDVRLYAREPSALRLPTASESDEACLPPVR